MKRRILTATIIAAAVIVSGLLLYIYIPRHIYIEMPIYDYNSESNTFSGEKVTLIIDIYKRHYINRETTFYGNITIGDELFSVYNTVSSDKGWPGMLSDFSCLDIKSDKHDGELHIAFDNEKPVFNPDTNSIDFYDQIDILLYNISTEEVLFIMREARQNGVDTEFDEIRYLQSYWKGFFNNIDPVMIERLLK